MNFLFKQEIIDYNFYNINASKTIIFLHGWGGNKNSFISTINLIKSKFNYLTLTMPTITPTKTVWQLEDYKNLIISLIKLHNIISPIIVCHSFGFRVSSLLNTIIDIQKIVVTGGAGPKKIGIIKRIKTDNNLILLKNKKYKYLYNKIASKDYQNLNYINKQTFKNIVNLNTKNLIKFNCPMLLFWGKFDTDTKLWIAKKIKAKNNAKLIVTNDDHFAYLKSNALFNNCVLNFLLN